MKLPRHPSRLALLGILAASLTGAACVSSSDIEGLHRQLGDVQKQIQTLEKKSSSKEEVEKLNQNVATQTTQLLKSNADMAVKLGELTTKMEQLEAKLEDTNRRLSQLSQQIAETQGDLMRLRDASGGAGAGTAAPPTGGAPGTAPAPGTAAGRVPMVSGPTPAELYDTSYADYTKGRYALAIQGFQDYLASYRDDPAEADFIALMEAEAGQLVGNFRLIGQRTEQPVQLEEGETDTPY